VESDQETLKVGIQSFTKGVMWRTRTSRQVRLLCAWAGRLMGLPKPIFECLCQQ